MGEETTKQCFSVESSYGIISVSHKRSCGKFSQSLRGPGVEFTIALKIVGCIGGTLSERILGIAYQLLLPFEHYSVQTR